MTTSPSTSSIKNRPPVVAVMGHIDHGKSTLLDYIRKTNIVDKEFGGITQHISAYEVTHKREDGTPQQITFLDTPGHEAFKAMRARGAAVADIAILVVSAEDGVKPQTLEALNTILEANIPYIVAINKIDKPNANIEKTKQSLAEHSIFVEGYGGNISAVPISAKTGENVSSLLDMIILLSDLEELKGDSTAMAEGIVIESNLDSKKGIIATVIVKNGTLHSNECVVAGDSVSPLRMMENFLGEKVSEATFSSPIRIIGWNSQPKVGSPFSTCSTKKEAEETALTLKHAAARGDDVVVPEGALVIPLILKTDVAGMGDAIAHELQKLHTEKVYLKIISSGTGTVTEGDIKAALPFSSAIIIGFNVKVDTNAEELSHQHGITIKTFNIIYKLTEWLEGVVEERTPRSEVDEVTGTLKVLKVFSTQKNGQVVGGRVDNGEIVLKGKVRIKRGGEEIGKGVITELQQNKAKTSIVSQGECGLMVETESTMQAGDILEVITTVVK